MARRVHLQDAGPNWVDLTLRAFKLSHTVAVGREGRILAQHACYISVAKDVPAAPVGILEDRLCGTHRAIPFERSAELLFVALCLHQFYLSRLNGLTILLSFSTIQWPEGWRV